MSRTASHIEGPWTPAVVIPAHNEAQRLPATLRRLYADGALAGHRVVIACNGCTDDTAVRARATLSGLAHRASVLDLPEPGKARAIRVAESQLPPGPRVVLDADAGCTGATVRALLDAVDSRDGSAPAALVAVPRRRLVTDDIPNPLLRSYYRVWADLPWIAGMPSGRAAYALAWEIRAPQGAFPEIVADDYWATSLVPRTEVALVDATVDVHPVPTFAELLDVRTRIYRGNVDVTPSHRAAPQGSRRSALLRIARRPQNWPGLAAYVVVDRLAHRRARRATTTTWTKR